MMWTRRELKDRAKLVMKRSYWKMFLVTLLAVILIGLFDHQDTGVNLTYEVSNTNIDFNMNGLLSMLPFHGIWAVTTLSFFVILGVIIGCCYSVFVGNAIEYGQTRFYLENAQQDTPFVTLFSAFQNGYWNIVKILLIRDIKIFLWTLLFVIPGVIKSYEYQMIPYLLAEDPTLSTEEVFAKSKAMTTGQKVDMFVLDLSFIGWMMLGTLLFGIGVYFVYPYRNATMAELYLALSDQRREQDYFD